MWHLQAGTREASHGACGKDLDSELPGAQGQEAPVDSCDQESPVQLGLSISLIYLNGVKIGVRLLMHRALSSVRGTCSQHGGKVIDTVYF